MIFSHEKVKRKDECDGEKISKVPKDERLENPPLPTYYDASSVLIEETKVINIMIDNNPHNIYLVTSLTKHKHHNFI